MFPTLLWRVPTKEKIIYLTFDDGPVPGPTEFVLETLNSFNALGTFFCIGDNVKKYPGLVREVVARGHTVGNHTFNHLKGWSTSTAKYVENVEACENQFVNEKVALSKLFRAPYGRISLNQIAALGGYKIVMWDVLSLDYRQSGSSQEFLKGTIKASRPGSIVVFHDSLKAEKNLTYMLPRFLEFYSNLGFEFKAL